MGASVILRYRDPGTLEALIGAACGMIAAKSQAECGSQAGVFSPFTLHALKWPI